jgi:hypothetical protein
MAIAVGTPSSLISDNGVGAATVTFSQSMTSGTAYLLALQWFYPGSGPANASISSSVAATVITGPTVVDVLAGNSRLSMFLLQATASGTSTVTITLEGSSTHYLSAGVIPITGLAASPSDVSATANGNGSNDGSTVTTASTTQADTILIGALGLNFVGDSSEAITTPSGMTQDVVQNDSNLKCGFWLGHQILSATGVQSKTWGFTAHSTGINGALWALKADAGGVTLGGGGEISLDQTVSVSGQAATGSVGTLGSASSVAVAITGQSATGSVGSIGYEVSYSITGQAIVSGIGEILSPGVTDVTHAISGVSGTFSIGSLDNTISANVTLTGFSITGSVGDIAAAQDPPSGGTTGNDLGTNVVRISVTGWADIVLRADPAVSDPTEPGYVFSNGKSFNSPT